MSSRIRGYVRNPTTGAGESGATVSIKKHSDNSTVTTDATDANGLYEVAADTVGYPGDIYETVTVGSTTKVRSGRVWGQLGGLIWASDVPDVFALLGIGVTNGLAVSADGSDMNVDISAGMAILKDGCPYILEAADDLTIGAADGSNPRIDRIILRLTREGQTDQGKISLMVLAGTPAGSPSAPSLTQSSSTWDLSLAQVLVGTGVTTIASNKVTDERTYAFAYPSSIAAGDTFYVDASGILTRLAKGTSGQFLKIGATIPAWANVLASDIGNGNLAFTGDSTLTGNLVVTGNAQLGNAAADATTIFGKLKVDGTAPTVAVNTSVCGSGSSAVVDYGSDTAFQITVSCAGTGYASGRVVTVTFNQAKSSTNYNVMIQEASSEAWTKRFRPVSRTTTTFDIYVDTAPSASETLILQVVIIEDV